jgi:hypothetical protein
MRIQAEWSKPHTVRFGEIYELRFQREGTGRQLREAPRTLNDSIGLLNPYFEQNGLTAQVYCQDFGNKRMLRDYDAGRPVDRSKADSRYVIVTDGPKEKTFSTLKKMAAETSDIQRRRREAEIFTSAAKFPLVTIRYSLRMPSPEDSRKKGDISYTTNSGKSVEAKAFMEWTNSIEVLGQLQPALLDVEA